MASARKIHDNEILSMIGIPLEMPDENDDFSDTEDDDLESELQALLTGKQTAKKVKHPKSTPNAISIDTMVSIRMKNPSPDEEDDDDDVSGDETLLSELHDLTEGTQEDEVIAEDQQHDASYPLDFDGSPLVVDADMIRKRLQLYLEAEAAVKIIGDRSKIRQYGLQIITLKELLMFASFGHRFRKCDLPPVVQVPKLSTSTEDRTQNLESPNSSITHLSPSVPLTPAPTLSQDTALSTKAIGHQIVVHESISVQLISRRNQYKIAALNAKKTGDKETALKYVKIAKKFDVVLEAVENGQSVDLSNMPPPPPEHTASKSSVPCSSTPCVEPKLAVSEKIQGAVVATDIETAALAAANEPADPDMFSAPEAPATILEALEQRLQKYCSTRDAAKDEGNNSKYRRLQRIVQQYEAAIKNFKAGKLVDFDDLPVPPGFAPIPTDDEQPITTPMDSKNVTEEEFPAEERNLPSQPPLKIGQPGTSSSQTAEPTPKGKHPRIQRANTSTILEKQLNFLLERQKLFRQAALESKKNGDIQQAKEYLRMSKGFDSMIDATKCGLPIDATTIPTPPQLEADFVVVDTSECLDGLSDEQIGLFPNLEKELQHQIEMCIRNKDHFMRLGDVSSASKFEQLGLDTKKDLAVIQHLWRNDQQIPRFHYETRLFSLVQCNTDLAENEIEVTVERGIDLPGKPDDLDAYVKIEFPIPTETPQKSKTHTVKDTNNPIYQEAFKFEINRKSRAQLRQFKRQAIKFEVWSKGGFFRSDTLLGTVMVKLVDLETKCSVHSSFDLLNGRKACGGKLEIKIRLRDPILAKQIEQVKEKWLVIDN